ncbi:MAG: AhpC/TSA family protein [Bacteroidales bacterium]|jgi:thiol-disulfide isomerase/thioredoxin|nr:AhpC/TSA family protein [Bacteroidales bacterium]
MKSNALITVLTSLVFTLGGCQSDESCTVKGTVQGVKDGAELVLLDEWNKYKVISSTTVENRTFEFHPSFTAPTHVYLYAKNPEDVSANPYDGGQLKDFFLEPGTVIVDVHADNEADMDTGATGTVLNDAYHRIQTANDDAKEALWEEAIRDGRTSLLALEYANRESGDLTRASEILDRLSPEQAKDYKKYIATMKKRWVRRAKAEERRENAAEEDVNLLHQHYIDMEYPDMDNNRVSLSSVVDNPANRYVILDFWATWCAPCVKSIPTLKEIYAKYHDKGVEIYSVSQDSKAKEWKSFVAENEMTWINVIANGGKVYRDYGIKYIPTVFLIDCKTGEILIHESHPDLDAILYGLLP